MTQLQMCAVLLLQVSLIWVDEAQGKAKCFLASYVIFPLDHFHVFFFGIYVQIKALEQDKTIEELSKSQEKLEKMKTKAEKQLTSVQSELHVREREAKEDKEKAKHLLESLTTEATALKSTLEEVMKREKQVCAKITNKGYVLFVTFIHSSI